MQAVTLQPICRSGTSLQAEIKLPIWIPDNKLARERMNWYSRPISCSTVLISVGNCARHQRLKRSRNWFSGNVSRCRMTTYSRSDSTATPPEFLQVLNNSVRLVWFSIHLALQLSENYLVANRLRLGPWRRSTGTAAASRPRSTGEFRRKPESGTSALPASAVNFAGCAASRSTRWLGKSVGCYSITAFWQLKNALIASWP